MRGKGEACDLKQVGRENVKGTQKHNQMYLNVNVTQLSTIKPHLTFSRVARHITVSSISAKWCHL